VPITVKKLNIPDMFNIYQMQDCTVKDFIDSGYNIYEVSQKITCTTTGPPLQQRIDALPNVHISVGKVYTNGL
jgi:hypothetical protein